MIRVSGRDALAIGDRVFQSAGGKKLSQMKGYTAAYGRIRSNGEDIDEAVALVFRAPHSYTGEDVVEFSCHGGLYLTRRVLRAVLDGGASPAGPGEFTRRAFLNGKMGLTEAEAVMDMIGAKGRQAARTALAGRDGAIHKAIASVKDSLVFTAAHLSAWADYPEEDIPQVEEMELTARLKKAEAALERLLSQYDAGKAIREGLNTVIAGRPNVGKSTLMNHLIGQKIAITSKKPQTTRNRIQTVYTCEQGQIVFVDTPGIHKAKNKLGEYMVNVAERTLSEVDVILWLVEPTTFIGAGERHIAEQLKKTKTPVILVINKIDTVKRDEILLFIDTYRKICDFAEIVPASALKGQNLQEVIDVIFKYLPYGPQFYDEDTVTDQPMRQIASEMIREKALRSLDEEIPHGIAVYIDRMEERKGGHIMDIDATIVCERDSHKGIIIGKGGAMLRKIGSLARKDIEEMLEMQVNLKLWVKVKKDWRDSDFLIKNFGYDKKDI